MEDIMEKDIINNIGNEFHRVKIGIKIISY